MAKRRFRQGIYEPLYPEKFIITKAFDVKEKCIKYRSSYELKFLRFADLSPDIKKVNSEGVIIPYLHPIKNKMAKYYMDFAVETKKKKLFLVEVKPLSECSPPIMPRKRTEKSVINYNKKLETYAVNQAKWSAAKEYARLRNADFIIITEKELKL